MKNYDYISSNLIYETAIKTENTTTFYVCFISTTLKLRYRSHDASFNNRLKRYSTELLNYIWELKDKNNESSLKFRLLCKPKTKTKKKFNV